MAVSADELRFLRAVAAAPADVVDIDAAVARLTSLVVRMPAWTEWYLPLLRAIGTVRSIPPPGDGCPQVVDVAFPEMAFSRAEWESGNLRLTLAPQHHEPGRITSFRVVGAEPRHWDVHGIDGVSVELTSAGLHVRLPMITGDLELIRGSY